MSALTKAVDAQIGIVSVDSPVSVDSAYPWRFTLDSEVVYVTGGSPTLLSVDRGCDDTVRVAHARGTTLVPAPIPVNGTGIHWRGAWDSGTDYVQGDAVADGGIAYLCLAANVNDEPPSANWEAIGSVVTEDLAATLLVGNDTGGLGIVNDESASPNTNAVTSLSATASGSGNATADSTASTVDGSASAGATAMASGIGSASAASFATAAGGFASVARSAVAIGDTADASTFAQSTGSTANATRSATSDAAADTSDFAIATGTGTALAVSSAQAGGGTASIGPVASATTAAVQVNGVNIFTAAAGAPGASFISLIYRDTTAITGRAYCWDFATGAYVAISGAF